jgi:hypothetical protein
MTFSGNAFMSSHSETQSDGDSSVSGRRSVQLPGTVTDSHSERMPGTVQLHTATVSPCQLVHMDTVRLDHASTVTYSQSHASTVTYRYSQSHASTVTYSHSETMSGTDTYGHSETMPVQ